ncbi:MAG: hypothetical protein ACYCSB_05090 [bacterium]
MQKNSGKKDGEINFRLVNLETTTLHNFFNFCIEKTISIKTLAPALRNLMNFPVLKRYPTSTSKNLSPAP